MQVVIERKFAKDVKKLKNRQLQRRVLDKMAEVEVLVAVCEKGQVPAIPNMVKLSNSDTFYRIRVGDIRMGISIEIAVDEA
ncbi:MAG: hypothetical protein AAFZ52_10150 [Bacteroidota bacterium]